MRKLLQRFFLLLWRAISRLLLSLLLRNTPLAVTLAQPEAAQQEEEEEEEEGSEEDDVGWVSDADTDDFDDNQSTEDDQVYWSEQRGNWCQYSGSFIRYWNYALDDFGDWQEVAPPADEAGADDEEEDADEPSQFHGLWVWDEETHQWRITVQNIERS